MAPRGLLLLASWALLGTLQLQADARPAPYVVKLCGREFIRAVIFTCGGSRWRRADVLAHDSLGDFFPDAEANTDNLASELDEAVGSSEWLGLTKSPRPSMVVDPAGKGRLEQFGAAEMSWLAFPAAAASGAVVGVKSAACARTRVGRWGPRPVSPACCLCDAHEPSYGQGIAASAVSSQTFCQDAT